MRRWQTQGIAWVGALVELPRNSPILQQQPFFDATYGPTGLSVHHTPSPRMHQS